MTEVFETKPLPNDDEDAILVTGEVSTTDVVKPDAAAQRADGKGRIGNTNIQAGITGAILVIFTYIAAMNKWDLDPKEGTDLPAYVGAAFGYLGTQLAAYIMNRKKLRATDD